MIIYAIHIVSGLALSWVWLYACHDPRLMDTTQLETCEFRYTQLRALVVPLIFVLSIGVSFFSVWATQIVLLLAFFIRPLLLRSVRYSSG